MKKSVKISVISLVVVVILIAGIFLIYSYLNKSDDDSKKDMDGDGDYDGYDEWLSRDCPYGKLTVGCIPEPSPINISNKGEYIDSASFDKYPFLSQYVNESSPALLDIFEVKEVLFDNSSFNVRYEVKAKLILYNSDMWITTGSREPKTLAGHFMGWDERGFYPNKGDKIKLNITIPFSGLYWIEESSV